MSYDSDSWDRLVLAQGHTGWQIPWVYEHDQALRLKGVRKVLLAMGINLRTSRVLDIGCGVGDFVRMFALEGANVTGIDISEAVLKKAGERTGNSGENVTLHRGSVETMTFSDSTFDLVTSITVLQHIQSPETFARALDKVVDSLKPGGHVLLAERAPFKVDRDSSDGSVTSRTLQSWEDAFEKRGCDLVYERAHPHLGIMTLLALRRGLRNTWTRLTQRNARSTIRSGAGEPVRQPEISSRRRSLFARFGRVGLILFRPLDDWLFLPPPRRLVLLRYMVFKKRKDDPTI